MKIYLRLSILVIFLILPAAIARAEVLEKETQGFTYQLFLPSDYDKAKTYPLIVAFHWSYGRAGDMMERWQEPAEKKKYIVACPNSAKSEYWDTEEDKDVFRMIRQIKAEFNIDASRVYLMGFSGGATITYYLGLNNPDKFLAICALAGSLKWLGNKVKLSREPARQIPVFIIHGSQDSIVDISESEYAKDILEQYGYTVKFMELKGEQHNYAKHVSWAIINWFDKQENK